MAKNKMKMNYKRPKRERNKENQTYSDTVTDGKNIITTFLSVLIFMALMYGGFLGLEHFGMFDAGYTAPESEVAEIDPNQIMIGSVFNRSEKTYYVLFDSSKEYENHSYIKTLTEKLDKRVYYVDMNEPENAKHKSDTENKKAKESKELKIKDVTLIKISKGKISKYLSGVEKIESFLENEK